MTTVEDATNLPVPETHSCLTDDENLSLAVAVEDIVNCVVVHEADFDPHAADNLYDCW